MSRTRKQTTGRGELRADCVYPVGVFMKRLGIGRHSLTALRRRGLAVRMIGTRAFVDGSEALAMLRLMWREEQQTEKPAADEEDA